MSNKVKPVNFVMKKAKISKDGVEVDYEEKKVIDGDPHIIVHNVKSYYQPHPNLIEKRNKLREFIVKAYHLNTGFDLAIKYLKGPQKQKAEESMLDIYDKIEVTGISIGGDEQLRGAVISGKIESNNKSKCAMNTPRIVFSSDKLGYEHEVEEIVNDIEREIFEYLFNNKKAQQDLFDSSDENGDVPKSETVAVGEKAEKVA